MTADPVADALPVKRVALLSGSVLLIGLALAWCFLAMRAVMNVGGACGEGGPYVVAQPCPDGAWLIAVGIPLLLVATFAGMFAAGSLGAPDVILPMWFLLFGTLGANFLEYGLWSDPREWGWIVPGVVFELMALPALYLLLPIHGGATWTPAPTVSRRRAGIWWPAYAGLALAGAVLGYASFRAAS